MLTVLGVPTGPDGVPGDELVDVLVDLVVAHVRHHVPVARGGEVRALVLQATEHRVLARRGGRVVRVDLDDPTEPERLVRLGRQVEARVDLAPAPAAGAGDAVAGVRRGVPAVERSRLVEVLVEVLFSAEHRAPGSRPARAVVERPQDGGAVRVCGGPQARVSSGRADHLERRRAGDPAVASRLLGGHRPPPTGRGVVSPYLDDRHPVALDLDPLHRRRVVGADGEHQLGAGELVVADQQALDRRRLQDAQVVVVVAPLPCGGLRCLVPHVERGSIRRHGVSPSDDQVQVEPVRDDDVVEPVRGDGCEVAADHPGWGGSEGGSRAGEGGADHQRGAARQGSREHRPAGEHAIDDLREGLVRAGVGCREIALVAALPVADGVAAVAVPKAG